MVLEHRIGGLAGLLKAAEKAGEAPTESWNPPYCGDIGLAIDRHGVWHYQGSPIRRTSLVKLFARVLVRESDGRHYLVTPGEKVDVAVEDAPFLAVEMQAEGEAHRQVLTFRTSVDDVVICDSNHPLSFALEPETGGLKPYIRVRGRLQALLTRSCLADLVSVAIPADPAVRADDADDSADDASDLVVWSSGSRFRLAPA